jgi:hypothetical protein
MQAFHLHLTPHTLHLTRMRLELQRFVKYTLAALFLLLQPGCADSDPEGDQAKQSAEKGISKKTKPGSSYLDTIKITSSAAVFYSPDSIQLEKIKAITDTMIFEGTMHDCLYQVRNSRNILNKSYKQVQIIEVKNARYIVFEKINREKEYVDLDTQNDPCGLFIFNGRESHKRVDMTNVETELGFYFAKRSKDQ